MTITGALVLYDVEPWSRKHDASPFLQNVHLSHTLFFTLRAVKVIK